MKIFEKFKVQDYLLILFLGVLLILIFLYANMDSYSYALDEESRLYEGYILNPDWIEYMELSDEEKVKYQIIPDEYLIEGSESAPEVSSISLFGLFGVDGEEEYPSYYNLKELGLVTEPRNQGSLGLCWAFAANASIESNLLISGISSIDAPITFSERQLDYASVTPLYITEGYNPYFIINRNTLGAGGYANSAFTLYSYGISPVMTEIFGEYNLDKTTKKSVNEVFILDNVEYFVDGYVTISGGNSTNAVVKEQYIKDVKEHIMQYGALYFGTIGPTSYYGGSCYYRDVANNKYLINVLDNNCNASTSANGHAMAVIGWDDDYEYEYCRLESSTTSDLTDCENIVSGKGAFILKNSWGNTTPYPYIAYDSVISSTYGVTSVSEKDWDNNYDITKYFDSSLNWGESIFSYKTDSVFNERIEKVSFYIHPNSMGLTFSVYVSPDGSDNYIKVGDVDTTHVGRYSIDVDSIDIIGDEFKVKITSDSAKGYAKDIYVFTSYADDRTDEMASTVIESGTDYYSFINEFSLYTNTKNIPIGSYLEYRLLDENNVDISSLMDVSNTLVFNNVVSPKISFEDKINSNKVTLQTIYNDEILDSEILNIEQLEDLWDEGSGSKNDPYIIYTLEDFMNIGTNEIYMSAYYKLGADIDFSSIEWSSKTFSNRKTFTGGLDGDGHSLYGVTCTSGSLDCSIFYKLKNVTIKNLVIDNYVIDVKSGYANILAYMTYDSVLENIILTDTVNVTAGTVSGLTQFAYTTSINKIANYGTFNFTGSSGIIGGIVGYAQGCEISEVYNYADLIGLGAYVGGIAGMISFYDDDNTIVDSVVHDVYNFGTISSSDASKYAGGIVGYSSASYINNAYIISDYVEQSGDYGNVVGIGSGSVFKNIYYYDNGKGAIGTVFSTNSSSNVVAKSLNDLKLKSTYSGFDFDNVWSIDDGYPYLTNFHYTYISNLNVSDVVLNLGETKKLEIGFVPENVTIKRLVYKSSNEDIVSVDNNGNMVAKSIGDVVITINTVDGSNISKEIKVSVISDLKTEDYERVGDNYIKINFLSSKEDVLENIIFDNSLFDFKLSESDNENIATGDQLFMYDKNGNLLKTYVISVLGDVTGSGDIAVSDVAKVYQYIKKVIDMDYEYQLAADVAMDGEVAVNDVAKLYQYIKGNIESLEE